MSSGRLAKGRILRTGLRQAVVLARAGAELAGAPPAIDFALSLLCLELGLPAGSAYALFGAGRTVGWIGHAIEQYQSAQLIRPRARYAGRHP